MPMHLPCVLVLAFAAGITLLSIPAAAQERAKAPAQKCADAERRVAKEQKHLAGVEANLGHRNRALKGCSPQSACATTRAEIATLEKHKARHEKRLARFGAQRDSACSKG